MAYKYEDSGNYIYMKNYFINVEFYYKHIEPNIKFFKNSILTDNDTPENIATRLYQRPVYAFLILLINQRFDPYYDWVLSQEELYNYATKYVTENYTDVYNYIVQHPEILTELSETLGYTITEYNPADPTDAEEELVRHIIGHYFTVLNSENDLRRKIFLPDQKMMDNMYNEYISILNKAS